MSQNQGAEALARAIQRAGLKRIDVEKEFGLSSGYMTRLLSGNRVPSRILALKLQERFGVGVGMWDESAERVPEPADSDDSLKEGAEENGDAA